MAEDKFEQNSKQILRRNDEGKLEHYGDMINPEAAEFVTEMLNAIVHEGGVDIIPWKP